MGVGKAQGGKEMRKILVVLAFAAVSCAAVSGPAPSAALGPLPAYYDFRDQDQRGGSFSIRAGGLVPSGGDEAFDPTWMAGMAYAKEKQRSTIKFMEFGVDYAPTKSAQRDATLFFGRFDVGIGSVGGKQRGPYGVAGLHAVIEDSGDIAYDDRWHWSIDLNLGGGYRTNKFDLRASYLAMLASKNVPGVLLTSVGLYF